MADILALLTCLTLQLDNTSLKQLGCIIRGMFAMSGRVTMLGISRWTGKFESCLDLFDVSIFLTYFTCSLLARFLICRRSIA
jgi:hypothetical protein